MKRRTLLQATAALAPSLATQWALAQDKYPSKPITWVCPYAAGGNADSRSRQVAKAMSSILGQTIIIDNKAGAGGNIGTEMIARGKPDGYTIGMGNFAPLAVNHALFKKLNFDPFNDLVPIALIERGPLILMVSSVILPRNCALPPGPLLDVFGLIIQRIGRGPSGGWDGEGGMREEEEEEEEEVVE